MESILEYFYGTPRTQQEYALNRIQNDWDQYRVHVIRAPTATGKSRIAHCIAKWRNESAMIIVPSNMLEDQYLNDHKDLIGIKRKHTYSHEMHYQQARRNLRYNDCVLNYWSYLGNRVRKNLLIVDEAHSVINAVQGDDKYRIWFPDYGLPPELDSVIDYLEWYESDPMLANGTERKRKRLRQVYDILLSNDPNYIPEITYLEHYGKIKKCLRLLPLSAAESCKKLWPTGNKSKIILMSATLHPTDIDELGFDRSEVNFIDVDSPIPAERRPVLFTPQGSMGYETADQSIKHLSDYLRQLERQHDTRGIVHVTYAMAARLKDALGVDGRYIFHTKQDKREKFREWQSTSNGILIACGMQEGIDLADDKARWQVIAKVNYPSMAIAAVNEKMKLFPEWYQWVAARGVLQASGRVCRNPEDYGVTYVTDRSFEYLFKSNPNLFPKWFVRSIRWQTKTALKTY